MSMYPQNRFPKLGIVSSTEKKPQRPSSGPQWWGPPSPRRLRMDCEAQTPQQVRYPERMTVMPEQPRRFLSAAMDRLREILRNYFATDGRRATGAAVLSFRRSSARSRDFRRAMAVDAYASKKTSGSVGWECAREGTSGEGGRR
jgi:hypothetical protein